MIGKLLENCTSIVVFDGLWSCLIIFPIKKHGNYPTYLRMSNSFSEDTKHFTEDSDSNTGSKMPISEGSSCSTSQTAQKYQKCFWNSGAWVLLLITLRTWKIWKWDHKFLSLRTNWWQSSFLDKYISQSSSIAVLIRHSFVPELWQLHSARQSSPGGKKQSVAGGVGMIVLLSFRNCTKLADSKQLSYWSGKKTKNSSPCSAAACDCRHSLHPPSRAKWLCPNKWVYS